MINIEIKNFAGLHNGGRCAIIGNGPSLNKICLDDLTEIPTFAVNQIYHLYDDTEWRPTYYAMLHKRNDNKWKIDGIQNNITDSIVFINDKFNLGETHPNLIRLTELGNLTMALSTDIKLSRDSDSISTISNSIFSDDLNKGYYSLHSELVIAQIVAYMGFSEVFLIGFDPGLYENQFVNFNNLVDMRVYANNKLNYIYEALKVGGPWELLNGVVWTLSRRFPKLYKILVDDPIYFHDKYRGTPKSAIEKHEHILSHAIIAYALDVRCINTYQVHEDGLSCYENISPQKFRDILKSK